MAVNGSLAAPIVYAAANALMATSSTLCAALERERTLLMKALDQTIPPYEYIDFRKVFENSATHRAMHDAAMIVFINSQKVSGKVSNETATKTVIENSCQSVYGEVFAEKVVDDFAELAMFELIDDENGGRLFSRISPFLSEEDIAEIDDQRELRLGAKVVALLAMLVSRMNCGILSTEIGYGLLDEFDRVLAKIRSQGGSK
jgi:hypothetical protein